MATPNSLFKYYTINDNSLNSIQTNTMWLSKPGRLNDPYDCALTLSEIKYRESVLDAISAAINAPDNAKIRNEILLAKWPGDRNSFDKTSKDVLSIFQSAGICSFSEKPDNILMWSHYAKNHTGFCVEFDFSPTSGYSKFVHSVQYKAKIPIFSPKDFISPLSESTFDSLWLTKAPDWAYEKEWRIFVDKGDQLLPAPQMISLAFGAKTTDDDKLKILEALRANTGETKVFLKQAKLSQEEFKLIIEYLP